MKKDRNTFFSNYNAQTQSYIPNFPQMPNQFLNNGQFGPYQQASQNSSYYAGPDLSSINDLENRISKLERQINRLDNRLTKLENTTPTEVKENNYSNNMYML